MRIALGFLLAARQSGRSRHGRTPTLLPRKPQPATIFRTCSSFNATALARVVHAQQARELNARPRQPVPQGRLGRPTDPPGMPNR